MKNITSKVLIFLCLIFVINTKAQVPLDSLTGYYIGEHWFHTYNQPWTITIDTVYVDSVFQGTACKIYFRNWSDQLWIHGFFTEYGYCEGNPANLFIMFSGNDSITCIYDYWSPPPPNNQDRWDRFYGKKAYIPVGLKEGKSKEVFRLFPNPAGEYLRVIGVEAGTAYRIRSLAGNEVQSGKINGEGRISTTGLKPGCYLLQCITENEVSHLKFIRR